jgi:hypothetical protein
MNPKFKSAGVAAVLVFSALAVLGEASTSGDGQEATNESQAESETVVVEETNASLGIGTPAQDGKFEFTVSGVECGVEQVGSEFLNETAQGQFCLVTMSVKNIGNEAQLFDSSSQKGITNTGAKVDANGAASLYANEEAQSFLESINPGNSLKDVVIVFDIAPDQNLDAVELHDSPFSGGVTVSLK